MTISRLEEKQMFAARCGWADADIFPLPSDASFRTYCRLQRGTESSLLMDAPPEKENLAAYLKVRGHMQGLGLRVPVVYGSDVAAGFALIEDFGADTFTRLLAAGYDMADLYRLATDVLVHLHQQGGGANLDVPAYDMAVLLREVDLFIDWFFPALYRREISGPERQAWHGAWQLVLADVAEDRSSLVLRDYHVDNMMILPKASGIAACGLLDFQDALIGSKAYDMVSLVEDARLDVPDDIRALVLDRFFRGCPDINQADFVRDMAILGAQRHAKVAGIFVRLSRRDGKNIYLKHIPRVLRLLSQCMKNEALAPVQQWFMESAPDYSEKTVYEF